jgi:hypothetical protein
MILPGSSLSPEVDPLLDCERAIPRYPPAVKARAVARARALMVAGGSTLVAKPAPRSRTRWFVAAAAACGVSVAFGAAAYEIRARLDARPTLVAISAPTGPLARLPASHRHRAVQGGRQLKPETALETTQTTADTAIGSEIEATALPSDTEPAAGNTASTRPQQRDTARGELRLLRQARDAVASGDYAAALAPIGRHTRRYGYGDGRLVEEREALRIKALAGLGRTEDAQGAAAAFQARFPYSVLLPVISRLTVGAP